MFLVIVHKFTGEAFGWSILDASIIEPCNSDAREEMERLEKLCQKDSSLRCEIVRVG